LYLLHFFRTALARSSKKYANPNPPLKKKKQLKVVQQIMPVFKNKSVSLSNYYDYPSSYHASSFS